jgi:hypothetical protein
MGIEAVGNGGVMSYGVLTFQLGSPLRHQLPHIHRLHSRRALSVGGA